MNDLLTYLLSTAVVGGIVVAIIKQYLSTQLKKATDERDARLSREKEYRRLDTLYKKAVIKVLFWLVRGAKLMDGEHKYFNGELTERHEELQTIERELNNYEASVLSDKK